MPHSPSARLRTLHDTSGVRYGPCGPAQIARLSMRRSDAAFCQARRGQISAEHPVRSPAAQRRGHPARSTQDKEQEVARKEQCLSSGSAVASREPRAQHGVLMPTGLPCRAAVPWRGAVPSWKSWKSYFGRMYPTSRPTQTRQRKRILPARPATSAMKVAPMLWQPKPLRPCRSDAGLPPSSLSGRLHGLEFHLLTLLPC